MITNRSAPTASIVPVLVYEDVEPVLDFLVDAFGFTEHLRARGSDGKLNHAQLLFGNESFIIGRQGGLFRAPRAEEVNQYVHVTAPAANAPSELPTTPAPGIRHPPHNIP